MKLQGNWNYPTNIRFGSGRLAELPDACRALSMSNPLLVTDKGLARLDIVSEASAAVSSAGISIAIFSDVKPNPNGENITNGVKQYKDGAHDGIIAFGGGSALDAGKAIALMAGQSRPIWDFEDVGDNWTRVDPNGIAPIIAIPTTSGTGSEVGRASVIVDESSHSKKIIFHPKMLPALVLADPQLTVALPKTVTAATGMDALSHNLEAYCAPSYHPMADGIALEGMRLIKDYLILACNEPDNIDARSNMMIASSMGATAFQKGLGAMHALAHPLGAIYDAHHGLLNAILMPYVLIRNRSAIEEKIRYLTRILELKNDSFTTLLDYVLQLRDDVGIPSTLASIGIDDQKADEIGKLATQDPSAGGNPIALTSENYRQVFINAVEGRLSSRL